MRRLLFAAVLGAGSCSPFEEPPSLPEPSPTAHVDALRGGPVRRSITIVNTTRGQVFSAPVLIAHGPQYELFELGQFAPTAVVMLAEEGRSDLLVQLARADPNVIEVVEAPAPLAPGQSVTLTLNMPASGLVSGIARLTATNDGFVAFKGLSTSAVAFAFDSGSEANTEDCAHIPGPVCDGAAVRATVGAEGRVYVHSGVHGLKDLAEMTYDFRGTVASVFVSTKP